MIAMRVLAASSDASPGAGRAPPAAEDFDLLLRSVATGPGAAPADAATAAVGAEDETTETPPAIAAAPGAGQPDLAQLQSLIAGMTGVAAPERGAGDDPAAFPAAPGPVPGAGARAPVMPFAPGPAGEAPADPRSRVRPGPIRSDGGKPGVAAAAGLQPSPDPSQAVPTRGPHAPVPSGAPAAPPSASAAPAGEVMIARRLDLAADSAWLDQLTRDIVRSADTGGAIRFSLAPEHLGRLDVSMTQTADGTAIRLTAETREAHRILSDAQPRLVAEARAQGLTLAETSVDLGRRPDGGQPQAFGNQNSGGGRHPQHAGTPPVPNAPASVTDRTPATSRDDGLYA